MLASTDGQPTNKVAAHWARKLANRKSHWYAFLNLGATSGAAPEKDDQDLDNTAEMSRKTFMFPYGRTGKATKKILLKHNLRIAAQEMNIVPGLDSALMSVPKLEDAGYTTALTKHGTAIYNYNTTTITASNPPILKSNWSQDTEPWRLNLNSDKHATPETINVIFNLPGSPETFLWYHASAGFPLKETFIDAVCNGNYATWPKLMVMLINRYYPDSDKTVKGHLKGQRQGIQSTKQKALEKIIENESVRIKTEGEISPFRHVPITKTHKAFFRIEDLSDSIHTNQTGHSLSLLNVAIDTSWWQSILTQTTSLLNLCVAGQRKR